MKILQINAVYGFGSTGLIMQDIGRLIEQNGDKPYFAYQQGPKNLKNSYVFNSKFDRYYHAIYTRIFGKQAYASKIATRKFLKWVDRVNPDIVHLHNLHGNYINLNMLLKYLAKKNIATVITMHDCWYFTGKCTHYMKIRCDRWITGCGKCKQKNISPKSIFFDASKKVLKDREKYITAIKNLILVGCSQWIANEAKKSKLKKCDIISIGNGISTNVFKPSHQEFRKNNNLENNFLILGFSNKWFNDENKKAVNYILKHLKDDERIVVVGCSKETIQNYKNNKKMICIDYIKGREKLCDIYSSCDVFVNLSHEDNYPTVNIESICSGTPVIAYDIGGCPELVDKNTGYIVKEDDYKEIINKKDILRREKLSIDTDKYREKFDKNKCFLEYIDVYKALYGKKK